MSTKALKSQLLAAVAMVLVSSIALGSSTFAWFSLNTKVEATGMVVKTQVSNNLFIAPDTTGSTAKVEESAFTTSLVQNVSGILEPVSTIDGVKYFYTAANNAAVNGDAISEDYIEYSLANAPADPDDGFVNAFERNYQVSGAVGYVDYAFRLKAINTGATNQDVVLTGLNLVYGGAADAGVPAYRVAMFVQNLGEGTQGAGTDVAANQVKGAYATSAYAYQTATAKAVNSTNSLAEISFNSTTINTATNSTIGTVAAGKTNYYKVVIRLWLEGEDKACTSTTFAALTDQWAMDVAVELKDTGTAGVAALTASTTTAKTTLSKATNTVAAMASYTIGTTSFYEISGETLNSDGSTTLYAIAPDALADDSRVYTIEDGYPIDVTNQITITA